MKKKFIAAMIAVVVAVFAGYNIYQSQNTVALSDLALANVEALANDSETSTSWTCEGWWGSCSAVCGSCGTKIEGDGSLNGTHSCSGH